MMAYDALGIFTENLGQHGQGAGKYYLEGDGFFASFAEGWVAYGIEGGTQGDRTRGVLVRVAFPGSNPVSPLGEKPTQHRVACLLGPDPDEWRTGIRCFREVTYRHLYHGVDLKYFVKDGRLKYEFLVRPGGALDDIVMEYSGVDGVLIEDVSGDLVLETAVGRLRDTSPVCYQEGGCGRTQLESGFRMVDDRVVGFRVEDHDTALPLVVDPVIEYSSFIGGGSWEQYMDMAVDGSGAIYVSGLTESRNFPTTPGAWDVQHNGSFDAFALKLNASLDKLDYSTFLGGSASDYAFSTALDAEGNLYLTGRTDSNDFPTTADAHSRTRKGSADVFVTVLNATGDGLVYSTYVGGSSDDYGLALCLDSSGAAYVSAFTQSGDFPTTPDAFDRTRAASYDIAVFKLDLRVSSLEYSTYLAGSDWDYGYGIDVDEAGCAYVTGLTRSTDFPVTDGSFDTTLTGGWDSFVSKINETGTGLVYSTYVGGGSMDTGNAIVVDNMGRAYVTGRTDSANFPVTDGAYDTIKGGGADVMMFRLSANGSIMERASFVGDSSSDVGTAICLDTNGSVYTTGYINVGNAFPITPGGRRNADSSRDNIFVIKMDGELSNLEFSSVYGGFSLDRGLEVALDNLQDVYILSETQSTYAPTTNNAYDQSFNGGQDIYLMKLSDFSPPEILNDGTPELATTGDPLTFSLNASDSIAIGKITVEYWFGDLGQHKEKTMDRVAGSDQNGTWEFSLDIPTDSLENVTYKYIVLDTKDNFCATNPRTVKVKDDDPPVFQDFTVDRPYTEGTYTFRVNAQDNIAVDSVKLVYWFYMEPENKTEVHMIQEDTDQTGNGIYNFTIRIPHTVPPDDTAMLGWRYWSNDSSGNHIFSAVSTARIIDNIPPVFLNTSRTASEISDPWFHFEVVLTDNVAIGSVQVEYWIGENGDDEAMQVEMGLSGGSRESGFIYEVDITLESMLPGNSMSFRYVATDLDNNIRISPKKMVGVVDNRPPVIVADDSDINATTGGVFRFNVTAEDNFGIITVCAVYWLGSRSDLAMNLTISPSGQVGVGQVTYTYDGYTLPIDSVEPLSYRFLVMDAAGSWVGTDPVTVEVRDNIAPIVFENLTNDITETSSVLVLSFEVRDNIGIERVEVRASVPGQTTRLLPMERTDVDERGNGIYSISLTMPRDLIGDVAYDVTLTDLHGNVNKDTTGTVRIEDREPPQLQPGEVPVGLLKGLNVTFEVRVEDNIGVEEVIVHIDVSGDDRYSVSMEGDLEYVVTFKLPRLAGASLTYQYQASDDSGNQNQTEPREIGLSNEPPSLVEPPRWNLTRGVSGILDLSQYISDSNDPIESIVISCEVEGVEVLGQTLRGEFDWDPGDYQIGIKLSDGEDSSPYTVFIFIQGDGEEPTQDGGVVGIEPLLMATIAVVVVIAVLLIWKRTRNRSER